MRYFIDDFASILITLVNICCVSHSYHSRRHILRVVAPWLKRAFNVNTNLVGIIDTWASGFVDELDVSSLIGRGCFIILLSLILMWQSFTFCVVMVVYF